MTVRIKKLPFNCIIKNRLVYKGVIVLIQISTEEIKKIELEILRNIAAFCDENGLTYYLAYGTLLGAIRHHGFIPWDDDIDIWMPRDDYEKFLKSYNSSCNDKRYKLISPCDENAKHTFAKVCRTDTVKIESGIRYNKDYLGIDVDIFPLDGQPEEQGEYQRYYNKKMKFYKIHSYMLLETSIARNRLKANIFNIIRSPFLPFEKSIVKWVKDKTAELNKLYDYNNSQYVGSTDSVYNVKNDRYLKKCFDEKIKVKFEGDYFYAPKGYDEILTLRYGDYMKLPPIEKRVTHHQNNCYWKNSMKIEKKY